MSRYQRAGLLLAVVGAGLVLWVLFVLAAMETTRGTMGVIFR